MLFWKPHTAELVDVAEIVLSVPPTVLLLVAPTTFTANAEIASAVVNVLFISYTSSSNSFIIVSTILIAGRLSLSGTSVGLPSGLSI